VYLASREKVSGSEVCLQRAMKRRGGMRVKDQRGVQVTAASRCTDAAVRRTANNVFAAHKEI
jgi:hypothetical protein